MTTHPEQVLAVIQTAVNYTCQNGDVVIGTAGAGGITVTLPPVQGRGNIIVRQADSGAGHVTIKTADGSTIDGVAGTTGIATEKQHAGYRLTSNGVAWFVIGS